MIAFRAKHPVFRRSNFFVGSQAGLLPDVWWFRPDGRQVGRRDWDSTSGQLGIFMNGEALRTPTQYGEEVRDDSFVVLFNAHYERATFLLPTRRFGSRWQVAISTFATDAADEVFAARNSVIVEPRSLVVLRRLE
jgi:glycogen operon protein